MRAGNAYQVRRASASHSARERTGKEAAEKGRPIAVDHPSCVLERKSGNQVPDNHAKTLRCKLRNKGIPRKHDPRLIRGPQHDQREWDRLRKRGRGREAQRLALPAEGMSTGNGHPPSLDGQPPPDTPIMVEGAQETCAVLPQNWTPSGDALPTECFPEAIEGGTRMPYLGCAPPGTISQTPSQKRAPEGPPPPATRSTRGTAEKPASATRRPDRKSGPAPQTTRAAGSAPAPTGPAPQAASFQEHPPSRDGGGKGRGSFPREIIRKMDE